MHKIWNWPRAFSSCALVALVVIILAGCTTSDTSPSQLQATYERSIAAAAVKTPDTVRTLTPIDATKPTVTVAHVQPYPSVDTTRYVWVSVPDDLKSFCKGKTDALLALQMALGLPPQHDDTVKVFTFDISPADLFRPCASSASITTMSCATNLPRDPSPDPAAEHFVLKQMMDSYRTGFKYPGYPFTAMGWSYDWDPNSATHQGVSEYVTKPGAAIRNVTSSTPSAFCGGQ